MLQDSRFRAQVFSDGTVSLWLAGKVRVSCVLDLTYFPMDYQSCYFQFNSWSYDSDLIRLTNLSDHMDIHNNNNPQWNILGTSAYVYNESFPDGTTYESVFYNIYLARKPGFFVNIIVVPCTMLTVVALFMFCLPADSGEKVSLGVTVLLSFSVFQLLVADIIPRSSDQIPLLCK